MFMLESEEQFWKRRPQRLCKMCGKCCRVLTASISYEEMKKKADDGDKESLDFLEIFKPFDSVEDAKKMNKEIVENIPDYENRTFYTCRFLDGNICSRYETRKEVCKRFPSSPFAVCPPGCGYEGWLFMEREKIMKYVRGLKEEQIQYRAMQKSTDDKERIEKLQKLIDAIDKNIKMFDKYGSSKW